MLIEALEELAERGELRTSMTTARRAWTRRPDMSRSARAFARCRCGRSTWPSARCCPRSTCGSRRSPAAARSSTCSASRRSSRSSSASAATAARRAGRGAGSRSASLLFWLGDLYTYSYPRLFGAEVPFPSLGDGVYLLVYPALMAGLLILVRRRNPERDRAGVDRLADHDARPRADLVDRADPAVRCTTTSSRPCAKLVSIAYPIGDILLLAAAIRLAVDTGTRRPAFYLLVVEHRRPARHRLRLRPGDARRAPTTARSGSTSAGSASTCCGARPRCTRRCASSSSAAPDREPRLTPLRLVAAHLASLIAPVMASQDHRPRRRDRFVVNAAAIVLFGLVVTRMAGLVRQQERSVGARAHPQRGGRRRSSPPPAATRSTTPRSAPRARSPVTSRRALCLARTAAVVAADGELDGAAWPVGPRPPRRCSRRAEHGAAAASRRERARGPAPATTAERTSVLASRSAARRAACSSIAGASDLAGRCGAASPRWRPRSRSRSRAPR